MFTFHLIFVDIQNEEICCLKKKRKGVRKKYFSCINNDDDVNYISYFEIDRKSLYTYTYIYKVCEKGDKKVFDKK